MSLVQFALIKILADERVEKTSCIVVLKSTLHARQAAGIMHSYISLDYFIDD